MSGTSEETSQGIEFWVSNFELASAELDVS